MTVGRGRPIPRPSSLRGKGERIERGCIPLSCLPSASREINAGSTASTSPQAVRNGGVGVASPCAPPDVPTIYTDPAARISVARARMDPAREQGVPAGAPPASHLDAQRHP
jgi:hypothetical protein